MRLWRAGVELPPGPPQQRTLLALLVAHAGQTVSVAEAIDVLWGNNPPSSATNVIHRCVGLLRRLLEPELPPRAEGRMLIRAGGGYRLEVDPESVDLVRFRRLVELARSAAAEGQTAAAARRFTEALALSRGELATGALPDARSHPVFVALRREQLDVLLEAVDAALAAGNVTEALTPLRLSAARHPLDEPLQARLVLAIAADGRPAEALQTWQAVRARLLAELGVEPGPQLRAAQERVLSGPAVDGSRRSVGDPDASGDLVTSAAATRPIARPRQLPADLAAFTGRDDLTPEPAPPGRATVRTIAGMGGIGKTTLAVHWAHLVAGEYPDGQLYVNLRGFDPTGRAMDPGEAIRGFLESLGIPPHRVPADAEAQVRLYRGLLAGRRMLLVLDNARDADQVRPLLPGTPGSLALVTSRTRLLGLTDEAADRPLVLGPLTPAQSRDLLAARTGGRARLDAAPDAVDRIVRRCAGLPLALAVVAARMAAHPNFALDQIAADLDQAAGTLEPFADPDPSIDVHAVFSWSHRLLSPGAARLLHRLSVHPGPTIGLRAAAALAGADLGTAQRWLAELTGVSLLGEPAPGRYGLHDLVRVYAGELSAAEDSTGERRAAVRRMLEHYLHNAHAACARFSPYWRRPQIRDAPAGAHPETFADDGAALAWFTAEHEVLNQLVALAVAGGYDTDVWHFAWTLERFYDRQGFWHEYADLQRTGLAAAVRQGERTAEAHLLRALARASGHLRRYTDAEPRIARSIALFTELGDRLGQAHAYRSHAWLLDRLGRHEESMARAELALDLYRAVDLPAGEASILHALGQSHLRLGAHHRAARYFREALAKVAGQENRYAHSGSWEGLGLALHRLGDHGYAVTCFEHAIGFYREIDDRFNEAGALHRLGDVRLALADPAAARSAWERAIMLLGATDRPPAEELRRKLDALDAVPPPARPVGSGAVTG
ncbi:AfsR/SARP family transcriptional regulator [Dactylosporangium sp. CA-233914]|uniref:AfsR/SARP family transcriptional regulator n=1 Tax=Dactylosporangium sp. CA-233914 TaxID=3239934 RepID=UPI003D8F39BE